MKKKFPLIKNNISKKDLNLVINFLKQEDPILTQSKKVKKFEIEWSKWLGVKYSVFVNSGSSANLISMTILKNLFPKGGNVIVPPLTWVSDIASVLQVGFKPKFVDINPLTLAMDTQKIIKAIDKNTKAVFLSHIQGFCGLNKILLKELKRRKIFLIEDVCESHGAQYKKKKLGSFGLISNFSFYYAHHLSTIEGGMVCTNDFKLYQMARMLRGHGMVRESYSDKLKKNYLKKFPSLNPEFIFAYPAYNLRNNEISAIIGSNQIKRLDKNIYLRNRNHQIFLKELDKEKFKINFDLNGSSNYAFNLVLLKKNKALFSRICRNLKEKNIEFRIGSAGGGNQLRQPYLINKFKKKYYLQFPQTEHIHFFAMYIGNYPELKINEIKYICKIINQS